MPFHHSALDFSPRDCQAYLASLANAGVDERAFPDSNGSGLEALDYEKTKSFLANHPKQVEVLPKICCAALQLMNHSTDSSASVSACRVLLTICSFTAAAATGCKSFSVLDAALSFVGKQVYPLAKAHDDPAGAKTGGDANDEDISLTLDEDDAQDLDNPEPQRKTRSRRIRLDDAKHSTDVRLLLSTVCETISLWRDVTDDYLLTSLADLLWTSTFLCAVTADWGRLSSTVEDAVRVFTTQSAMCLLAAHRAALPILSCHFSPKGPSYAPSKPKTLKSLHQAVGKVYVGLVPEMVTLTSLSLPKERSWEREWSTPLPSSKRRRRSSSSASATTTPASLPPPTPASAISALSSPGRTPLPVRGGGEPPSLPFSLPALAVLGLVQRLVLAGAQEKASARSLITDLVPSLLAALRVVPDCVRHLAGFLSRLLTSSHVVQRSMALEVASSALLLGEEGEGEGEGEGGGLCGLLAPDQLDLLVSRCLDRVQDSHLAVRLRALAFLSQALAAASAAPQGRLSTCLSLHRRCRGELRESLRSLALGEDGSGRSSASVRVKAVQALTRTLALQGQGQGQGEEALPLLPSPEDLQVYVSLASSASQAVSVRKAALQGLADLVLQASRSRPAAASDLEVCLLTTALPLLTGPSEAGLQAKAADLLDELLLSPLGAVREEEEEQAAAAAGWRRLAAALALGLAPLLRCLLARLLAARKLDAARLRHTLQAIQTRCSPGPASSSSSSSSARRAEAEEQAQREAAWRLLDLLVSLLSSSSSSAPAGAQEALPGQELLRSRPLAAWLLQALPLACGQADAATAPATATSQASRQCALRALRPLASLLTGRETGALLAYLDRRLACLAAKPAEADDLSVLVSLRHALVTARPASERGGGGAAGAAGDMARWSHGLLARIASVLAHYALGPSRANNNNNCAGSNNSSGGLAGGGEDGALLAAWAAAEEGAHTSSSSSSLARDVQRLVRQSLLLLGEIAMLGFRPDEADVASLRRHHWVTLDPPRANSTNPGEKDAVGAAPPQFVHDPETQYFKVVVPARLMDLVKVLMAEMLPSQQPCPETLRATAFVVFGKLCLRDFHLARENVNIFVRELDNNNRVSSAGTSASLSLNLSTNSVDVSALASSTAEEDRAGYSVRNNALFILGDLCIKYTHLVDAHIDALAACLQDRVPAIRRHALLLLTQLLGQEYVKLKGSLFYRLLLLLNDADGEIQTFATDLLQRTLRKKHPAVFQHCFVDLFLLLNGCTSHPLLGDLHALNLATPLTRSARFAIYEFIVQGGDKEENKIHWTAKLVQDLIAVAVDHKELLQDRSSCHPVSASKNRGHSSLPTAAHGLTPFEIALEDALLFLQSWSLKISSSSSSAKAGGLDAFGGEDEGEEEGEGLSQGQGGNPSKGTVLAAAKQKVLSAITSQHLLSHTLPVLLSLKHILEATKSPLQGVLMDLLVHLFQQHRTEVQQVLGMDPTLKAEIEYDLKQYEKQKKASQMQASGGQKPPRSARKTGLSPLPVVEKFLDPKQVPLSSVKKPVLRSDMPPPASTVRFSDQRLSAGPATTPFGHGPEEEDEDPMLRLAEDYHPPAPASESHRRRSWGVVISDLVSTNENETSNDQQSAKKRRVSGGEAGKSLLASHLLGPQSFPLRLTDSSPAGKEAISTVQTEMTAQATAMTSLQREASRGKRVGGGSALLFR